MKFKRVSQAEFNQLDNPRKIIVNDYAQVFAIVDLGESLGQYGLS